jgi:hypothetical protein
MCSKQFRQFITDSETKERIISKRKKSSPGGCVTIGYDEGVLKLRAFQHEDVG